MTGAGSASLAFVKEDSFGTLPGDPTYYLPGRNPTIQDLSLDNVLSRLREPGNAEAVDSLAGNLEGAFGVSYAMSNDVHGDVRDIVFNDGGTGFTSGLATTSRWYTGVDYVDGTTVSTAERELSACIPLEYQIQYQQGQNTIRETLTMGYADESLNTAITPGSITGPTDGNDVPFHGAELTVDATVIDREQSITLSFSNISRYQRGSSRTATNAVLAAPETTLDVAAIYGGNDTLELAYGGTSATAPEDQLTNVSGDLTFDVGGTTVATYSFAKLKPDSYEWADLLDEETDLTDPVTYHVNGGISIA
jgi:hypothetical protein